MAHAVNTITKKFKQLFLGVAIVFVAILSRLLYLQIVLNDAYVQQSKKNYLRVEYTQSPRGNILDSHGNILATNRPVIAISWRGTGNKKLTVDQKKLIDLLQRCLGDVWNEEIITEIEQAELYRKDFQIAYDVSLPQLSCLLEQTIEKSDNLHVATLFKRYYPHQTTACHVLGYLGSVTAEPEGRMGLEKSFEEQLKGIPGTRIKTINSVGAAITHEETQQPQKGTDIVTTIDLDLQKIAESVFPEEYSGAFIIMDPEDGSIPVMFSRPAFDPTIFLEALDQETWDELQDKHTFLNRACNACYPPASPFKLISISAALEQKIVSPNSSCCCYGYTMFRGRKYFCARKTGHGILSTQEAVAKSCNALFFDIAQHISIDKLAYYARLFGFGEKTQDILLEKEGLVPDRAWKRAVKREPWWPGENLSAIIGQSYLLATPLQMARMIGSITTGYLVQPRILQDLPVVKRPLGIAQSTRKFLRRSMKSAVEGGTAIRTKHIRGMKVEAKTGTAQTSDLSKRTMGNQYLEHAWFVANFRYKKTRKLTMVIIMEHAGSSSPAVAVGKDFLIKYRDYMEYPDHKAPEAPVVSTAIAQEETVIGPVIAQTSQDDGESLESDVP